MPSFFKLNKWQLLLLLVVFGLLTGQIYVSAFQNKLCGDQNVILMVIGFYGVPWSVLTLPIFAAIANFLRDGIADGCSNVLEVFAVCFPLYINIYILFILARWLLRRLTHLIRKQ